MVKYMNVVLGLTALAFFNLLIVFTIINLVLNCQTWDQSLWTQASSCVTPYQLLGIN